MQDNIVNILTKFSVNFIIAIIYYYLLIHQEEETEHIYLTEQELDKIFSVQIANKKLDQVRDLFIFGAWVCLRFSNFSNIMILQNA